ncbi:D-amino-acid dehydrogenase [Pseudoduganella flava]|uniref:D-amino-acid dehydrogenase n=1 Tax=Pseudoduganella flava TaxID=871742 RepID=A0A562PGA2_9BURK|nr:D-amino acid dehydrogenase [Pseudoduganella flava]QGZ40298.1 FAD-dependent oxidoreductase [Pseudoduganella flava]TWI43485.1 D-amino-acid dehydrogenase [Pseudoduganella flava]
MRQTEHEVVVIGGGVVGLTSAWWLLEAGFRVTLVERAPEVGSGASYRNGGQLSYRYVSPLADAGVPWKALQWLFQDAGPLRFKPEADLRQWRWLARFIANCNAASNRRTTAKLLELGEHSRRMMAQLESTVPLAQFGWRDAGKLVVYRSRALFDAAVAKPDPDNTRQVLSGAEAAALEPALAHVAPRLAGGIFNSGEAVADCHAFCVALEQRLREHPRFDGIVHANAQSLFAENGRITAVETDNGWVTGQQFVLAAGIQSRGLAATANIDLPLYPLKGYSLTAPIGPEHTAPEISVTDFERKTLYARIGERLRIAAMVDMVGEDTSLDPRRIDALTRLVRDTMPRAADYTRSEAWAGLRPATPNSAPLLGPTRHGNLWLNVGHGPLGFTFACGTAALLADLMTGRATPFALDFLAWRS